MGRRVTLSTYYSESTILSLARAAERAGVLAEVVTAFGPRPTPGSRLASMPVAGARLTRHAVRRYAGVPAASSSRAFVPGLVRSAAWRLGFGGHGVDAAIGTRFDRAVARRLRGGPGDVFVGQPFLSLRSFERALALGMTTVLNHVNADAEVENAVIRAEAERLGVRPRTLWPDWVVRRVRAEVDAADRVLVPSPAVLGDLRRRGVPAEKLVLLRYGVDASSFGAAGPVRPAGAPIRVLYVGQVALRKGLPHLDAALGRCAHPVASARVVGPVVDRDIPRHTRRLEYAGSVGADGVRAALAAADVFVFPSLAEGMARSVLEAMAAGLPVVATEPAGYGGVVETGVNGFLVPPADPQAIADALDGVSADPSRAAAVGAAARRTAERLTWERHGDGFLAEVLAGVG